ncbi:hypothetical protein BD769DRAFT_1638654 [Suillus cothurnatus]|nr:hypothetical protein BD769DRAFT_1638654 [Suillus cothurnatus]
MKYTAIRSEVASDAYSNVVSMILWLLRAVTFRSPIPTYPGMLLLSYMFYSTYMSPSATLVGQSRNNSIPYSNSSTAGRTSGKSDSGFDRNNDENIRGQIHEREAGYHVEEFPEGYRSHILKSLFRDDRRPCKTVYLHTRQPTLHNGMVQGRLGFGYMYASLMSR